MVERFFDRSSIITNGWLSIAATLLAHSEVPLGNVLGPLLLFLLYINDLHEAIAQLLYCMQEVLNTICENMHYINNHPCIGIYKEPTSTTSTHRLLVVHFCVDDQLCKNTVCRKILHNYCTLGCNIKML